MNLSHLSLHMICCKSMKKCDLLCTYKSMGKPYLFQTPKVDGLPGCLKSSGVLCADMTRPAFSLSGQLWILLLNSGVVVFLFIYYNEYLNIKIVKGKYYFFLSFFLFFYFSFNLYTKD